MTIDEAIQELKDASDSEVRYGDTDHHYDEVMKRIEAFDMAIKALEQQPCDDCISRAYIESIVEELENICINGDEHILSLLSNIKNAPSVTPKADVLDKIRAEIMQLDYDIETVDHDYDYRYPHLNMAQIEEVHMICREEVLQIIDKYRKGDAE